MTISTFLSSKYGKLWGLFPKDPFFGHQVAKILPPKKKIPDPDPSFVP
jgi:hypothetical protein